MDDNKVEVYLKAELGLNEVDKKICLQQVKSFKCCAGIKGYNNCQEFLELVQQCYKNQGRNIEYTTVPNRH